MIPESSAEELWHLDKKIYGLTTSDFNNDGVREIISVGPLGELCFYNPDGTLCKCLPIPAQIASIDAANLKKDSSLAMIGFTPRVSGLEAIDLEGVILWSFDTIGINDVVPSDINNDGVDEIIIGYNGQEGVALLDSRGEAIWQNVLLTNVGHVSSGDLNQDGTREIIITSQKGSLHVFNADGNETAQYSFRDFEASFVQVLDVFADSPGPEIVVSGRGKGKFRGEALLGVINKDLISFWQVNLGPSALLDSAIAHSVAGLPSKGWLAVGAENGTLNVFDRFGRLIFNHEDVGQNYSFVAWLSDAQGKPVLICSGRESGLHAYAVDEELVQAGYPEIITPPGFMARAVNTGSALNYPYYLLQIGYFCLATAFCLVVLFRKFIFKRKKDIYNNHSVK